MKLNTLGVTFLACGVLAFALWGKESQGNAQQAVRSFVTEGYDSTVSEGSSASGLNVHIGAAGVELSLEGTAPFHLTGNAITNQRLIDVPESSIRLVLWEETLQDRSVVPYYAISLDGRSMAAVRPTSYVVKLRHGDFDPSEGEPPVDAALEADQNVNLYIVQFDTQPLNEFRAAITDLGGTVYNFLAYHSHIVKMSPQVRDLVATLPYVRWVGFYQPAYRLEEFMLDNIAQANELYPLQRYNIQVFEAGLEQKTAVAERIEVLGGTINKLDAGKFLLEATLTPEQLFEVVRWNEVLFVDRWSPYEKDMNNARQAGGANYIESIAGYTGAGIKGEVFDAGFNLNHVDFASRPLIQHGPVGSDTHGAATSGICFGDGTGDPNARGLLPNGLGIVADYNYVGMTGSNRYNHTGELVQMPYQAVFQTASVGSARTTQYTTVTADTDAALFDFDIVHCQSQSNAGNQMSRPQAWAKNIISGGGVYHYNTLTTSDDCWCYGASTGPAADGRIKPDFCAYYDWIRTTTCCGSNSYTSTFGGTSGATPIICGHVGLFFQMWAEGIFGNPVDPGVRPFDNRSHMTTAKAMLINTANQYPFSGTNHDLTRTHQGWGWPDMGNMYDLRNKMFIIDETEILTNLNSVLYTVNVGASEPAMRATLVYADPPGTTSSSQHRINDLTLKVTSPSATVYWGNNGLLSGNWSTSGGSANTIDTVENVYVQNPQAGAWTVEVFADEINQDSHVETPDLDADFALVVSGVWECTTGADCDDGLYCNGLETCVSGSCQPGTPVNCDDGVACTDDSCNETTQSCDYVPNGALCADGDSCTDDICDSVTGCVNPPINCDDGDVCTTDSCDPATGCVNTPIVCDDGDACTADSCDPASGCVYTPINCDDGDVCTTDSCDSATGCVNTPIDCDDTDACTADSCDPASGCVNTPIDCDDGDACTTDSCDPATGCVNDPIVCLPGETCIDGVCVPDVCDNDGTCEAGEDCNNCPADCFSSSGAVCGNGICEAGNGEDCVSCPADCNGKQNGKPSARFCCGDGDGINPVSCSDSRCTGQGFYCTDVPGAPSCCGDGVCEGSEGNLNCEIDCGQLVCGDGFCDPAERCSCPSDCGAPLPPELDCSDGRDNDCDGLTDCDDNDCTDNLDCCIPTHTKERGGRCRDGIDNDCDGLIDGDDPDCTSGGI